VEIGRCSWFGSKTKESESDVKPCDKHWTAMHAAVEARGMMHLVKTAEQAQAIAARQFAEVCDESGVYDHEKGRAALEARQSGAVAPKPEEFDPLMAAYWMVMNRALEMGGLYLMDRRPDGGEYCPICEAGVKLGGLPYTDRPDLPAPTAEEVERMWIDGPADAARKFAVELGLIARQ